MTEREITIPGYIEIVETSRWEGGKLILGAFSRHYDYHGNLMRETEPSDGVVIGFGDMSRGEIASITRGQYMPPEGKS